MTAKAFKVELPAFFDEPQIADLFARAFGGDNAKFDVDPEEMRRYMRANILEPGEDGVPHWLNFWVAHMPAHGFCGFIIGSYTPWPLCPNMCLSHFHVDVAACTEALLTKAFGWSYGLGRTTIALTNATGRSDAAHMRRFRKFATGHPVGTVINYDLTERWTRGYVSDRTV